MTFVAAWLRWTARAAVWLCTGSAVLLSIAFGLASEPIWWIELVRYVPFPVFLLPALAAAVLALLLGRRWRVAALAGLGLVAVVIMGLEVHAGDKGQGRLRLMTYNIKAPRAGERPGMFAQLAREIVRHDPDIILMQDAHVGDDQPQVSPDALAIVGDRNVSASGQYIIASRHPLKDCRAGDFSSPGRRHHYLRCVVTVAGTEIDLITAHLTSPRDGLNATRHERLAGIDEWQENFAARLHQARSLARDLAGHSRPLILAGDLNAPENSPVVRALKDIGLRDAFSAAGRGYGYTHGHSLRPRFSFLRIDHVLVSPDIGVADCFVGGSKASEHRPVIADLLLVRDP